METFKAMANNTVFPTVFAAALFAAMSADAAPFERWFDHRLPDGRVVRIHGEGDEYGARFEDESGRPLVYVAAAGRYEYAAKDPATGAFAASGVPLGADDAAVSRADLAPAGAIDDSAATRAAAEERMAALAEERGTAGRWAALKARTAASREAAEAEAEADGAVGGPLRAPPSAPTTGRVVGVTLLVDFPLFDETGVETNTLSAVAHPGVTADDLRDLVNGADFSKFGNASSVREYYARATSGHLDYTNVVIGWIKAPFERSHYDVATSSSGTCGRNLLGDVLAAMKTHPLYKSEWLPALRQASVNGDGEFTALNVFFAGPEATTWSCGLWAHQYVLAYSQYSKLYVPMADGTEAHFRSYQITPVTASPTIHTFCHESGHMVCDFPDLYAYTGLGNGVGMWCLMCGRVAGGDTDPQNFCAYLRAAAGWVVPKNLPAESGTVTVAADLQDVWKYPHPTDKKQYYLVENRQASGTDKNLQASGIVIYRCDESGDNTTGARTTKSVFSDYGFATNRLSYEVSVEQADGLYEIERDDSTRITVNGAVRRKYNGDPDDAWFDGNGADLYAGQFHALSTPCARWTDGTAAAINLSNFSANGDSMTFWSEVADASGGDEIDLSSAIYVNGIDTSKHTSWEKAGEATYWRVTGGRIVLRGSGPYTIAGTGTTPVRCAASADDFASCKVVLSGVRITSKDDSYAAFDAGSTAFAPVLLAFAGTNVLASAAYSEKKSRPAIYAASGKTLVISGADDALLSCQGGKYAAGIGGGYNKGILSTSDNDAGTVRILGGTVRATGGYNGAGIGGGNGGTLGRVDVHDALVVASGGTGASGIGGGYKGSSGNFFNYGGTVWATGGAGDGSTPDIGRGADSTSKLLHRLYISGGSTSLANGYVTGMTSASNSTERVYRTVVSDLAPGERYVMEGLPSGYGQDFMVADASGQLHLWLPNGDYALREGDADWTATVSGGKTYAETLGSEYGDWLMAHGFLDHAIPSPLERAFFENQPGPCAKPGAGGTVLSVRDEYVSLLDPDDPDSVFRSDISIGADGLPAVTCSPFDPSRRDYVFDGKEDLGSDWETPADPARHHFFRARVRLP